MQEVCAIMHLVCIKKRSNLSAGPITGWRYRGLSHRHLLAKQKLELSLLLRRRGATKPGACSWNQQTAQRCALLRL